LPRSWSKSRSQSHTRPRQGASHPNLGHVWRRGKTRFRSIADCVISPLTSPAGRVIVTTRSYRGWTRMSTDNADIWRMRSEDSAAPPGPTSIKHAPTTGSAALHPWLQTATPSGPDIRVYPRSSVSIRVHPCPSAVVSNL
jgi:hypothetical protein